MKFDLEPDNYKCPDEVLLKDLALVARKLNKDTVTRSDYDKYGRFHSATLDRRFGGWNKALAKSGLLMSLQKNITKEELLIDLVKTAKKLNLISVSRKQYESLGKFSSHTCVRVFGSWHNALLAAELKPDLSFKKKSDEELFDNLATVWETLGRQPKRDDLRPPLSLFFSYPYVRRFGSWRSALVKFVEYINRSNEPETEDTTIKPEASAPVTKTIRGHKTPRNVTWRLRFLVMKRDNFTCRCGASPAKDFKTILHVDHVRAWSKGGETIFENLQTLCETCNIGKGNID